MIDRNYSNLSKSRLRPIPIANRSSLYEGVDPFKNKKVIQTADDGELNTLIKFLHFLSNGEIVMKKANFEKIHEGQKLKLLTKTVEKKSKTLKLVKGPRKDKIKFLNRLLHVYSALLYCLFNEP